MTEVVACAIRELNRRRGRFFFQVGTYVLAALFFTVLGNLLLSSHRETARILDRVGTHLVFFVPASHQGPASFPERVLLDPRNEAFYADPMVRTHLLASDVLPRLEALSAVSRVSPMLLFRMKSPRDGTLFSIAGFDPENSMVTDCCWTSKNDLSTGAFLFPGDRGLAVVDEAYAVSYGLTVGSILDLGGSSFPVIGIVRSGVRPIRAEVYLVRDDAVEVVGRRLDRPLDREFNLVLVEVKSAREQDRAVEQLEQAVPGAIVNTFSCNVGAARVMGMSESVAAVLLCLVFAGTLVGSMISQWGSVVERRRDIGILKALGWTSRVVLGQVLIETGICAALGGVLGVAAGWAALAWLPMRDLTSHAFEWQSGTIVGMGVGATVCATLGGLCAAFVPALFAARATPADALRRI